MPSEPRLQAMEQNCLDDIIRNMESRQLNCVLLKENRISTVKRDLEAMIAEHINRYSYVYSKREDKEAFKQKCIQFSQHALMTFDDMCTDEVLAQTETCEKKIKKALEKLEEVE